MLIAGIFLILVLTTVASYVMKKRGVRLGYVWLILAFSGFAIWLVLFFVSFERISPFTVQNWFRSADAGLSLNFKINRTNWAMIFTLLTMHISFLLTAAIREDLKRDFIYWIVESGEIALTFAILVSADLLTVVLTWAAMDIAGLLYKLFLRQELNTDEVFYPYTAKLLGSFLLVFNMAKLAGNGQSMMLDSLPATSSQSIFFAAVLHSGIIHFKPFKKDKRLTITILDFYNFFLPFISSLFLITYLPENDFSFIAYLILLLAFLIIAFHFIRLWMNAQDDLSAIRNLLYSFFGLIGFRYLTGTHNDSVSWFVLMVMGINWLLIFSHRSKSLTLFAALMLISISGLPFSLVSYGNNGIITESITVSAFLLVIYHIIFNLGYLKRLLQKKLVFEDLEQSFQIIYMVGLSLTLLSLGVCSFRSMGSLMDEIAYWWIGILVVGATTGFYFWTKNRKVEDQQGENKTAILGDRIIRLMSLGWVNEVVGFIYRNTKAVVFGFSQLLEGEGGVLWSIVFLALLFTLLKIG